MGDIPLNEVVYFSFPTQSPATMVAVNADSTPTFTVKEEDSSSDIGVGGNASNTGTGEYVVTFTCSAANGFEVGKFYNVMASATVGGIAGKKKIASFRISAAENVAGYHLTDVQYIKGTASAGQAGYVGIDWGNVYAPTTTVSLTGTTIKNTTDINTLVTAVKASTDNLPSDPADQSLIIDATNSIAALIGTPVADLATDIAGVKTVANGVKAKTDSLTFTQSGVVDANITYVNEVAVGGSGTEANPWQPA